MHMNAYLCAHSSPPDAILRELAHETAEWYPGEVSLPIAPEQGTFMTILTRLIGARSAIEIGTFTGYSSICLARGLPADGHLLCCDISDEWTSVARKYWERAGLGGKIELRLGPALDTVRSLPGTAQFDLAFIDADKTGYAQYYEEVLTRLRPGGLILLDNTLQGGHVVGDLPDDEDVAAIRSLNDAIAADPRVKVVLIPIGDGVSFVQKLGERQ